MIKINSPILYVGAKKWLQQYLIYLFEKSERKIFVDACAGSMSAGIGILVNSKADIIFNEKCKELSHLHYLILNKPEIVKKFISNISFNSEEFRKQVKIRDKISDANTDEIALSLLYTSRTCFRGNIWNKCSKIGNKQNGTIINGREYFIDDRISIKYLHKLIDILAMHAKRNKTFCQSEDCIETNFPENAFLYFDPPYIGQQYRKLYGAYTDFNHSALAEKLKNETKPWLVSYSAEPEVIELYNFANIKYIAKTSAIANSKKYTELLISNFDF